MRLYIIKEAVMVYFKVIYIIILSMVLYSCVGQSQGNNVLIKDPQFNSAWYQGKAEITSYTLDQARYGEKHPGHAVLIFVAENFSKIKQVKLDNSNHNPSDVVPILKLNHTRKFNTGIYPYSLMTSTFTPVEINKNDHSLKVTTSMQDWCGHTYMQFNQDKKGYQAQGFSYFESEGDMEKSIETQLLEDEIWTRLRINPSSLPIGEVSMIPAQMFLRLKHVPLKSYQAITSISNADQPTEKIYTIRYTDLQREIHIRYESNYPYQINGWTEKYKSGFGTYGKFIETTATLNKRIWTDYWTQNSTSDLSKYHGLLEIIE